VEEVVSNSFGAVDRLRERRLALQRIGNPVVCPQLILGLSPVRWSKAVTSLEPGSMAT
jgi:hypothetical protein